MKFLKSDLCNVLSVLAKDSEVYVPGFVRGIHQYKLWEGEEVTLDGDNTVMPPKDILFPKTEKMYTYKNGPTAEINEIVEKKNRVIFGLRPCDARSIACMDSVFIKEGYEDTFYARRRNEAVLVGIACPGASDNCFCESMGVDPNNCGTTDLFLSEAGEYYYVRANTEKGNEILKELDVYISDGEESLGNVHCKLQPKMSDEISRNLVKQFDNDSLWNAVSEPCLHCGTCSFVCPTCYCFDINNENVGDEGVAFRCWDSCMFSDYNLCAGGHNPRPTKKEKLRNRYLHKLAYFNERHDMELCVGCGRCINKCPGHLDITEFIDIAAEVCHD